jgi:hypothetical protein
MSRISKHISNKEAFKSGNASRAGIKNEPTPFQLQNMKMVANKCFEPLREWHNDPIYVSSFLRSKALNEITPGASKTSQHLQGEYTKKEEGALDIDCDVYDNGLTNAEAFYWLRENVEFDQLIWEFGDDENPAWVHISYRKGANRGQVLQAYVNEKGKRKYKRIL